MQCVINITDIIGIERAEMTIDRLALVAGDNSAGKSTLLGTVARTVIGQIWPPGHSKKDGPRFVRDGAKAGYVTIKSDEGTISAAFPAGEVKSEGRPLRAHPLTVGTMAFADLPDNERALFLADLLKSAPTDDDILAAFKDLYSDDKLAGIVENLKAHGWDATHETAKTRCTEAKRDWEKITGEKYGSLKGAAWRPVGWTEDHGKTDPETFGPRREALNIELAAALKAEGAGEEKIATLRLKAEKIGELTKALDAARAASLAANKRKEQATTELNDSPMPQDKSDENGHCPACKSALRITPADKGRYKVAEAEKMDAAAFNKAKKKHTDAATAADTAATTARGAQEAVGNAEAQVQAAMTAKAELEKIEADGALREVRIVAEIESEIAKLSSDYRAIAANTSAAKLHSHISKLAASLDILAPEGLRRRKLAAALNVLNNGAIAPLAQIADWAAVTIDEELRLWVGKKPYGVLCSESERWRANALLSLAFAIVGKFQVVVLDRADVLSPANRDRLFAVLSSVQTKPIELILVGMTVGFKQRKAVPDLDSHGLGSSWWVENGKVARAAL